MSRNLLIILTFVIILVAILIWLFISSSKPLSGEKLLQDGRNHLPEGSKIDYKFNPPTSGEHYAAWIIKGFYDEPRSDGYLVHSMEHGYVILWYDCDVKSQQGIIPTAYAHMLDEEASPTATSSAAQTAKDELGRTAMTAGSEGIAAIHFNDMPKSFSDGSCDGFKGELKAVYEKFGPHKLIVMPRPNMGKKLVLTAWGRMEEYRLVDQNRIKKFIDTFRDNGPEHTIEP